MGVLACYPLCVEKSETERDAQASDYPESKNDGDFAPTHEFEVMLQWRHLE
jgi:hypothetical protein